MIRQGITSPAGTLERAVFNIPQSGVPVRIDPSSFKGSAFCDVGGMLVAGTPLKADGTLPATGETAAYVLPYGVAIANSNSNADLDASPNGDIAARTGGDLIRDNIEGNIGRALTSAEVASITASGRFTLL